MKENIIIWLKNLKSGLFLGRVKRTILFFLVINFSIAYAWAGKDRISKPKHFFAGLNIVAYKGSLQDSYKRWTPALQAGLSVGVRKNINLTFGLTFGQFIGEDRNYRLPATADASLSPVNRFKTNFISLGAEFQFKALEYKGFKLFGSLGLGLFNFSPKDFEGNELVNRTRTRNRSEDYGQNAIQFPIQMVAQYWFNPKLGIGFQGGWLNVNSRHLDNMDKLANNSRGDNVAVFRFQVLAGL